MIAPQDATRKDVEIAIQAWIAARETRLEQDKICAKFKSLEDEYKSFILEAFKQQHYEGMIIGGRSIGLTVREVPVVVGREEFCKYVLETQDLSLLEFRPSKSAIEERGVENVPGTEMVETYDLFNRKT